MHTRKLAMMAVLLALCAIGAHIKVMGSIAFDSFPAFLGGLLLGPRAGFFLGAFGHLLSAALAGFPLSGVVHAVTALMMGLSVGAYSLVMTAMTRRGTRRLAAYVTASAVAYVLINIVALAVLYPWLGALVYVLFVPLTFANGANLLVAAVVYESVPPFIKAVGRRERG